LPLCRWEYHQDCSFDELRAWEPTGIVAMLTGGDIDRTLLTFSTPIVYAGAVPIRGDWPQVIFDQRALGRAAADHLHQRGHRRLVAVSNKDHGQQKERVAAFLQRISEHSSANRSTPFYLESISGDSRAKSLEQSLAHKILSLPKPVGLFAASSQIGFLIAELCREQQIRIPDDLAIVTVGDPDGMADLAQPALSSVNIPWRQVGFEAAQLLCKLMHSEEMNPQSHVISAPAQLRARSSTDLFAVDDPDLATALAFIQQNLHRAITVDQAAKKASLSRRILEIRFQEHLRKTPMEFIRGLRLDQAQKLLFNPDLSIGQIARQCGFSTATHFGVAFRRAYAQSPSEFRRQLRTYG
jgi:LacI family transcriptional regulator